MINNLIDSPYVDEVIKKAYSVDTHDSVFMQVDKRLFGYRHWYQALTLQLDLGPKVYFTRRIFKDRSKIKPIPIEEVISIFNEKAEEIENDLLHRLHHRCKYTGTMWINFSKQEKLFLLKCPGYSGNLLELMEILYPHLRSKK